MEQDQSKGSQVLGEIQQIARSVMAAPKNLAAERLGGVAEMLRETAHQFHGRQEMVAGIAGTAAEQVQKFATTLRDSDIAELVSEVENLARRKPVVLFGGAVAFGFVLSRFWKSGTGSAAGSTADETGAEIPRGVSLH